MGVRKLAVLGLSDFPPKEKTGAGSARHRREGKKQAAQGSTLSEWIGCLGERKKPRHRNESADRGSVTGVPITEAWPLGIPGGIMAPLLCSPHTLSAPHPLGKKPSGQAPLPALPRATS